MPTKRPAAEPGEQIENEDWRVQLKPAAGLPVVDADLDDELPFEETAVDRVFSVLETARSAERATVKLYRITKPGAFSWCDDYTVDEFESGGFAMIREKWGAGEYEIRLYAIRPADGRFGVMAKPRITIEASNDPAKNPIVPAAPAVDPAMREMLAQMANTQAAMLQALTNRPDPMANMQQMLALAASFKQAFGDSSPRPQNTISEIMGAIREMKAVAEEISPPKAEDSPDSPWKMLPGVLDLVGKFAPQFQGQQAPALPAPETGFPGVTLPQSFDVPATPQENPAPVSLPVAAPSTDIPSDEEMNALQVVLMRGYLAKLCAMSATGNVEDGAQFAIDKLPDEAIEVLENPAWFEALSGFYPGAAPHRAWLTAVRDRVIQIINAPD
jgi:hypothetical protein